MKTYLLFFDAQSEARWSYTHSSVPVMAESPQEAIGKLNAIAEELDERILTVTVYERLETPSGGWLESSRADRVEYEIDSFGIAGRRKK